MARTRAPKLDSFSDTRRKAPWRQYINQEPDDQSRRFCDWPGCSGAGEHPAPKSREKADDRHMFCQEHAREYNKSWNYYEGMSEDEVEADRRKDTVWDRPSWHFGTINPKAAMAAAMRAGMGYGVRDDFGVYDEHIGGARDNKSQADPHIHIGPRPGTPEERAMSILDLSPPLSAHAIKTRYKELVKRHHPDANGGDKAAEEKFKEIGEAYRILMATVG